MKINLMKKLCKMNEDTVIKTMSKYLFDKGFKVRCTHNYILAEGDIPIALVAHADTVFPVPPTHIYYDHEQSVMWSPEGLGADDRAGIYAIIDIIEKGYKPHIIITTGEESGGIGARAVVNRYQKCPFKNLKAIFEIDRRGVDDCVFYECDNKDFIEYVEEFGFVEEWGTFTDISILAPAWGVAAANLSSGYENEHSPLETLDMKALSETIAKVCNILEEVAEMPKFKYVKRKRTLPYGTWNVDKNCVICEKEFTDNNPGIVIDEPGIAPHTVCKECYELYYQASVDV